jgi:hypothetical protein
MVVMEELVPMCDRGEIAGFSPTSEIDDGGAQHKGGAVLTHETRVYSGPRQIPMRTLTNYLPDYRFPILSKRHLSHLLLYSYSFHPTKDAILSIHQDKYMSRCIANIGLFLDEWSFFVLKKYGEFSSNQC